MAGVRAGARTGSPRDALVVTAYRAAGAAMRAVPPPVGIPLARGAGRVAGRFLAERRRVLGRHLRRAHGLPPDGPVAARDLGAAFASYGRYWYELFRLPHDARRSPARAAASVGMAGWEHVEAGLAAGRGVIVALPHLGGWEAAATWVATRGHRPLAVAEQVEPPELFEWFVEVRDAMGIEVVGLGDDALVDRIVTALRDNRIVTLVCDRDLGGDGPEVEFFGERTTLPAGPALLALRTGAALVTAGVYFAGRGHRAVVRPPVPVERQGRLREDVRRVTQLVAHELEAVVRAAPDQWHLLQPNWPSDREDLVPCG